MTKWKPRAWRGRQKFLDRFMIFLLIFTGYWIVYWQLFIRAAAYMSAYVNPKHQDQNYCWRQGHMVVITLTVAINLLTQRLHAFTAIILGTLITSLAWLILIVWGTVPGVVVTLIAVALGEITQSPRYYEYISRLGALRTAGDVHGLCLSAAGDWVAGRWTL